VHCLSETCHNGWMVINIRLIKQKPILSLNGLCLQRFVRMLYSCKPLTYDHINSLYTRVLHHSYLLYFTFRAGRLLHPQIYTLKNSRYSTPGSLRYGKRHHRHGHPQTSMLCAEVRCGNSSCDESMLFHGGERLPYCSAIDSIRLWLILNCWAFLIT